MSEMSIQRIKLIPPEEAIADLDYANYYSMEDRIAFLRRDFELRLQMFNDKLYSKYNSYFVIKLKEKIERLEDISAGHPKFKADLMDIMQFLNDYVLYYKDTVQIVALTSLLIDEAEKLKIGYKEMKNVFDKLSGSAELFKPYLSKRKIPKEEMMKYMEDVASFFYQAGFYRGIKIEDEKEATPKQKMPGLEKAMKEFKKDDEEETTSEGQI